MDSDTIKGMEPKENRNANPKKDRSTQWAASKHHPTKSELEKDLSIPDATPEKLARAVANYDPRKPNSGG